MPSHGPHPDLHLHGLADGCDRCEEIAAAPWKYLDQADLAVIVKKVTNQETRLDFRTNAEGRAYANVMTALEHAGVLFSAAPFSVEEYLKTRWGGGG